MRRWGLQASGGTVIAFVSVGEFGNQSHEETALWADGKKVPAGVNLRAVLAHFRDEVGLDLGNKPIDLELERHRGEEAAEKWVAEAGLKA